MWDELGRPPFAAHQICEHIGQPGGDEREQEPCQAQRRATIAHQIIGRADPVHVNWAMDAAHQDEVHRRQAHIHHPLKLRFQSSNEPLMSSFTRCCASDEQRIGRHGAGQRQERRVGAGDDNQRDDADRAGPQ